MIGAIAGDVIGSPYEHHLVKTTEFPLLTSRSRFTDDTVLTVAVADALTAGRDYAQALGDWGRRYPNAGYGHSFRQWLFSSRPGPYNSWGNGSAMRVSPVGFLLDDEDDVLAEAARSAAVTHNHPEGIKGAQAVALSIWLARHGADQATIRSEIGERFGYDLTRSLVEIRPTYGFDVSCQGSVPEALIAFFEAAGWEGAIRNAVSLGGDADTQACIAGAVAEACFGGVPQEIARFVSALLPDEMVEVVGRAETAGVYKKQLI